MADRKTSQNLLLGERNSTESEIGHPGASNQAASELVTQPEIEASLRAEIPSDHRSAGVSTAEIILSMTEPRGSNVRAMYKPLPSVPEDIKFDYPVLPPAYDSATAWNSGRPSNQQRLSFQQTPGRFPSEDTESQVWHRPVSSTQTVICAFVACLCIPVLGWVPLAFACLMSVPGDEPSIADFNRRRVRKFIILLSSACILLGLFMWISFLVKCFSSGRCSEYSFSWRHWHLGDSAPDSNSSMNL